MQLITERCEPDFLNVPSIIQPPEQEWGIGRAKEECYVG